MVENKEANDEWNKIEYEQSSEDFRHNTVMGWQSFIAMIAADGVLLAQIPNVQNNRLAFFVLLIASLSTFLMAFTSAKWTYRNRNDIKNSLENFATHHSLARL